MSTKLPAVIDTSLVLTLASAGALEHVLSKSRYRWNITPLVRAEFTRRETREAIDRAIASGLLSLVEIDTNNSVELQRWVEWDLMVDRGEAEAIALALTRKYTIGIEDRQAQRELDRRVGPGQWINSVNLLLDAVDDGVMTIQAADAVFLLLDSYSGYKKRGILSLAPLRVLKGGS